MKAITFAPAARSELDAAIDRYEDERPGRGMRFAVAVERTTGLIQRFPSIGPQFFGVRAELGVRQRIVRGFPFVLAYRDLSDAIRIDAVAHMQRRPGYWRQRIR